MRHGAWDYQLVLHWLELNHYNNCFLVHQPIHFSSVDCYLLLTPFLSSFGKAWSRTEAGLVRQLASYVCNLRQRTRKTRPSHVQSYKTSSTCMTNDTISSYHITHAHTFYVVYRRQAGCRKDGYSQTNRRGSFAGLIMTACLVDSTQHTRSIAAYKIYITHLII